MQHALPLACTHDRSHSVRLRLVTKRPSARARDSAYERKPGHRAARSTNNVAGGRLRFLIFTSECEFLPFLRHEKNGDPSRTA